MQVNYHVLDNSVILNFEGKTITLNVDDSRYNSVIEAIKNDKLETIPDLVDYEKQFSSGDIQLRHGLLHLNDKPMPECLSSRVLDFQKNKLPYDYLIKFAKKLETNPSFNSREQLFKFLEHNGHPITKNGNFIAYRGVTADFKDHHTRKFDNSVGSVCEMKREAVDDNPNNTCSNGLHVACFEYADGFGAQMIEVEVDPKDVVAVPADYNGTKMRVCKFKVVNVCEAIRNTPVYDEDDYAEGVDDSWDADDDLTGIAEDYEMLPRFNKKVSSSAIERLEYRGTSLTVSFTNGNAVRYTNVSCETANEFLNAYSLGSYYTDYIKGQYPRKELD